MRNLSLTPDAPIRITLPNGNELILSTICDAHTVVPALLIDGLADESAVVVRLTGTMSVMTDPEFAQVTLIDGPTAPFEILFEGP